VIFPACLPSLDQMLCGAFGNFICPISPVQFGPPGDGVGWKSAQGLCISPLKPNIKENELALNVHIRHYVVALVNTFLMLTINFSDVTIG
jgi:hypothetical protein